MFKFSEVFGDFESVDSVALLTFSGFVGRELYSRTGEGILLPEVLCWGRCSSAVLEFLGVCVSEGWVVLSDSSTPAPVSFPAVSGRNSFLASSPELVAGVDFGSPVSGRESDYFDVSLSAVNRFLSSGSDTFAQFSKTGTHVVLALMARHYVDCFLGDVFVGMVLRFDGDLNTPYYYVTPLLLVEYSDLLALFFKFDVAGVRSRVHDMALYAGSVADKGLSRELPVSDKVGFLTGESSVVGNVFMLFRRSAPSKVYPWGRVESVTCVRFDGYDSERFTARFTAFPVPVSREETLARFEALKPYTRFVAPDLGVPSFEPVQTYDVLVSDIAVAGYLANERYLLLPLNADEFVRYHVLRPDGSVGLERLSVVDYFFYVFKQFGISFSEEVYRAFYFPTGNQPYYDLVSSSMGTADVSKDLQDC